MWSRNAPRAILCLVFSLASGPFLVGCIHSPGVGQTFCRQVDGNQTLQVELLFGRDIAGLGTVSDVQWADFLSDEVTPRFPAGLTVLAASGQWRDAQSGQITQERTFIVQVVATDSARTVARLEQIRRAYKERFKQQSVGLTIAPICSSF
jgi:Protein of unknown function (DUF3574)